MLLLAVLVLCGAPSCAASLATRAAEKGDSAQLRAVLAQERAAGKLDGRKVGALALVVAAREIERGSGDEGLARIEETRACSVELRSSLETRARRDDAIAAAATMSLLEGGPRAASEVDRSRLASRTTSVDPLWRAAAARTLAPGERARFLIDPDERVRLAVLRSAVERPAPSERHELLEVARLDPSPLAQSLAIRSLGAIGGAEVVLGLRDRYERADDAMRAAIVEAWGSAACRRDGGNREIANVAQSETGLAAIAAGVALLQSDDAERGAGLRTLVRIASEGATHERVAALARLPLAPAPSLRLPDGSALQLEDARKAVESAAQSPDTTVRLAALVRQLELAPSRPKALVAIRALAGDGSQAALFALAQTRDPKAVEQLRRELGEVRPEARLAIARALLAGGATTEVAGLLADPDAHVRTSAACAIVASRR